jgi:CheY-like chemotaxis protein
MTSRPSVLVCDDEPNLRELIRLSLGPGYDVHEAEDGEEALALARSLVPELVILDLMMPRLNGFDVLADLKADPALAQTRILVVTAQPASKEEARAKGADGVIVKPFAPEELAELAATLVAPA